MVAENRATYYGRGKLIAIRRWRRRDAVSTNNPRNLPARRYSHPADARKSAGVRFGRERAELCRSING